MNVINFINHVNEILLEILRFVAVDSFNVVYQALMVSVLEYALMINSKLI